MQIRRYPSQVSCDTKKTEVQLYLMFFGHFKLECTVTCLGQCNASRSPEMYFGPHSIRDYPWNEVAGFMGYSGTSAKTAVCITRIKHFFKSVNLPDFLLMSVMKH
jgi:hypothetical protein